MLAITRLWPFHEQTNRPSSLSHRSGNENGGLLFSARRKGMTLHGNQSSECKRGLQPQRGSRLQLCCIRPCPRFPLPGSVGMALFQYWSREVHAHKRENSSAVAFVFNQQSSFGTPSAICGDSRNSCPIAIARAVRAQWVLAATLSEASPRKLVCPKGKLIKATLSKIHIDGRKDFVL